MLRKIVYSLMELPDREVKNNELSAICGTSESMISKFFSYEKELSFYHYISLIRELSPDKEIELVEKITEEFISEGHRSNCRMVLEYASTTRNFPLLEKMIKSQMEAPKENKDWARLYSLLIKFQKRSISGEDLLTELECYSPKYPETKALSKILFAMVYYWIGEFRSMYRAVLQSEKIVESIKNPFIRESFTVRVCEIFARMYLYVRNDTKKARYYAKNALNSNIVCDKFKVHLYHLLGTSFLFEDYEEAVLNFKIYKDKLISQGRFDLAEEVEEKDIFFANVLWGINLENLKTSDDLEKCHLHARLGIPLQQLNKNEKDPFYLCYKGISEKDAEMLMKSAVLFINNGNKFFANLPLNELKNYNNFRNTAETLLETINIA
jgi:hypothetical protein